MCSVFLVVCLASGNAGSSRLSIFSGLLSRAWSRKIIGVISAYVLCFIGTQGALTSHVATLLSLVLFSQLFFSDPSGMFVRYKCKAIGSGSEGAQSTLQEGYSDSLTLAEAEALAVSTLKQVTFFFVCFASPSSSWRL